MAFKVSHRQTYINSAGFSGISALTQDVTDIVCYIFTLVVKHRVGLSRHFETLSYTICLTMDLGLDRRIKAEWFLVKEEKSTTGIMKKTTKVSRIIEIVLENFHSRPKTVTVYDQIPMAKDNVTQVQLNHVTPELKKGEKSLKRYKEKGFLEWDIEVNPGAPRTIHYEYTITFPSDQTLLNLENP